VAKSAQEELNAAINDALKLEGVRTRLVDVGIDIQSASPERFGDVIKNEVDKWGRIVKEAGIQPE
jgi:tripartite-type tricarboxylate transporter receptor subunit TctC